MSKIVFIEPKQLGEHIFSRFALPRIGVFILGTMMKNRGWDVEIIIEDIEEFLFCGFTDGLTEITNSKGEEFGEDRVAEIFRASHQLSMAGLSNLLIEAAMEFGGDAPQADDITLVLVRRLPE